MLCCTFLSRSSKNHHLSSKTGVHQGKQSTVTLSKLKDLLPEHEEQSLGLPLDCRPDEYSKSTEMGIPILSQQGPCETINSLQSQSNGTVKWVNRLQISTSEILVECPFIAVKEKQAY